MKEQLNAHVLVQSVRQDIKEQLNAHVLVLLVLTACAYNNFLKIVSRGKVLFLRVFFVLFCFRGCIDFKLCTCMFSMNLHSSVFASPSTAPARVAAAIYVNIFVIIFKKSLWARYAHAVGTSTCCMVFLISCLEVRFVQYFRKKSDQQYFTVPSASPISKSRMFTTRSSIRLGWQILANSS